MAGPLCSCVKDVRKRRHGYELFVRLLDAIRASMRFIEKEAKGTA